MKINARVELTDEEINNILVGAIESGNAGIGYWALIDKYHPEDNFARIVDTIKLETNRLGECKFSINSQVIRTGVNKIINDPKLEIRSDIRNSIMTDNMDAECYDCIIQVGLFGEIKYC